MRSCWGLLTLASLAALACDRSDAATQDAGMSAETAEVGPMDSAGHAAPAADGSLPLGDATVDARAPSGDASVRSSTLADAESARAAALSDAGTIGGAGSDAARDPSSAPELQISSDTATIEFTPALVAAQRVYPGRATVRSGGIVSLFNDAQADLATNAETQALRQSVQHPDLRIVFTVTETFYRIIARRSAGIAQLTDLRGKRVGTVPNTSAHYYLDKMLRTVGLSVEEVSVVSAFPLSRMPMLLQSGQVDAVTAWEPEPQRAADLLGSDAIEFQERSVYREIVNLHTTAAHLANPEKRRGIVAFVRALIPTAEQFQQRPDEVWPLVATAIGYEPALLAKVWPHERFPGTLVDDLLDVLAEEEAWLAGQSGRAPRSRAQLASLIDDSILREALALP